MFYFGCLLMGLAIAIQAFGHHALLPLLDAKQLTMFDTASRYVMWGSVWVMVLGIASRFLRVSSFGMALIFTGLMLFCGSLFVYIIVPSPLLMMVTPIGGVFMIAGFWIVAIHGWIGKDKETPKKAVKPTRQNTIF